MLRLCSGSSRFYPGRSVRHAVAICESALCGNMLGDQAEVSSGHSRCGHRQGGMTIGNELRPAKAEDIAEVSPHRRAKREEQWHAS